MKTPVIFQCSKAGKGDTDGASRSITEYDDPFLDLSYMTDNDVFGDESLESKNIKSPKKRKMKNKGINISPAKATRSEMDVLNISKNSGQDGEEFLDSSVEEVKLIDAPQKSGETDEGTHRTGAPGSVGDFLNSKKGSVEKMTLDKAPVKNTQSNTNQEDPDITSENFLENLLTMQNSLLKPLQTQSETIKANDGDKPSASDKLPQRPWTPSLHTDWKNFFEVCN